MIFSHHFGKNKKNQRGAWRGVRIGMAAAGLLALLTAGCAMNKYNYGFDGHFSLNVAPPPAWLTKPKAPLGLAEKEVLAQRGMPNFIHFWWKTDGSLIRSSDLSGHFGEADEMIKVIPKSWIYLEGDKGEEVVFSRNGASHRDKPLSGLLKLLCQYGDPSSRSDPFTIDGDTHETWIWIEHGLQIDLVGDKINSTKHFKGTGVGTDLMK